VEKFETNLTEITHAFWKAMQIEIQNTVEITGELHNVSGFMLM
jgi:uncharacterized protein YdeI (BOF family)